ncbi:MAG TPA: hypothetical protein VG847_07090 [Chitinophagaceae bacterium]|nr:hypothetical protein [Chitinophagaceae bacterium]
MKEYNIKVPEDAEKVVTAVMEKFGVVATAVGPKKKPAKKQKPKNKKRAPNTRVDHTYLFGKWKDFDIDPKKLREDSW